MMGQTLTLTPLVGPTQLGLGSAGASVTRRLCGTLLKGCALRVSLELFFFSFSDRYLTGGVHWLTRRFVCLFIYFCFFVKIVKLLGVAGTQTGLHS